MSPTQTQTPTTHAAARAALAEHGHTPRTTELPGIGPFPVDWGRAPIDLDDLEEPRWWGPPHFDDWVSVYLAHDPGGGPVVYRLEDSRNRATARPVLSFRPVNRANRPRWAILDRPGARSVKPLASLLTVLSDLDRLSALIDRSWQLAASATGEPTAKLWHREADELDAFRAEYERRHVGPLAAQWLATAPPPTPTTPPGPRLVPVTLR